jgi:hypothetical protein
MCFFYLQLLVEKTYALVICMVVLNALFQFQVNAAEDYSELPQIRGWLSVVLKFEGSKEEFPELGIQIIHQNETFTARGVLKSYRLETLNPT